MKCLEDLKAMVRFPLVAQKENIAQLPLFSLPPLFVTIDAYLIFRAVLEKGSKPSRGRPFGPPFPGGVPKAEIGCGEVIGNRRCFPGRALLLPAVMMLFRDSPDRSGLLFSGVVSRHKFKLC